MEMDPWIEKNSRIDAEKLHALGVVTLNWNTAEFSLFWLFCTVSGVSGEKARIISHDMQTPSMQAKIKELSHRNKFVSTPIKELIEFALSAFDICRQNRNQFTHFLPSENGGNLGFFRNKGSSFDLEAIPSDLGTIRRVAEEIAKTSHLVSGLGNALAQRTGSPLKALSEDLWPTLPERFPLPEKVWNPRQPSRVRN